MVVAGGGVQVAVEEESVSMAVCSGVVCTLPGGLMVVAVWVGGVVCWGL